MMKRKHVFYVLIPTIFVIIITPILIFSFIPNISSTINYKFGVPCSDLPDIEVVRQTFDEHQDIVFQIENISPGNVFIEVHECCDGKGEIFIYYDTIATRNEILELIGGDFFGIPIRLFNI